MQRRRAMLAAGKRSRLPRGYQEVEYLESTGTQYIDTGFIPNQDTRVVCDFYITQYGDNCIFGSRVEANRNTFVFLNLPASDKFRSDYGISKSTFTGGLNQWHHIDKNKNITYFDNAIYTVAYEQMSIRAPLTIFARNQNNTISAFAHCKITPTQIYDNGTLVRNLILCYRESDNKPGMYDLCGSICPLTNSPFYINAGTDEFLVGPDVN